MNFTFLFALFMSVGLSMSFALTMSRPTLYALQQRVYIKAQKFRFRILVWGRRTGKTSMIEYICTSAAVDGKKIYLFAPSPETYQETWINVVEHIGAGAIKIDNTKHLMVFENGGRVKMSSLHNRREIRKIRGKFIDEVIYDEAQSIDSDILKEHWENSVMPTLVDTKGSAWFMGTPPNSKEHYLVKLYCRGARNNVNAQGRDVPMDLHIAPNEPVSPHYISFRKTAYENPYIDPAQIDLIGSTMPPMVFQQEFKAQFVDYSDSPWVLCFDDDGEVERRMFKPVEPSARMPFYISFDFNLNPMAATIWQMDERKEYIVCLAEFGTTKPNEKVSIHYTTDLIKLWFIKNLGIDIARGVPLPPWLNIYITGDATGTSKDPRAREGLNFYEIISKEFRMDAWKRKGIIHVPSANPTHKNSWAQVNSYLYAHKGIRINPSCIRLRSDMKLTQSGDNHAIDKENYDPHYFDTLRYFMNTFLERTYGKGW